MGRKPYAIPAARDGSTGNLYCDIFIVVNIKAIPFFAGNAPAVDIDVVVACTDIRIAGIDGGFTRIRIADLAAVHIEDGNIIFFGNTVIVQLYRA